MNTDVKDAVGAARFGSGKDVRRIEDPALLRGQGRFTDDLARAGRLVLDGCAGLRLEYSARGEALKPGTFRGNTFLV